MGCLLLQVTQTAYGDPDLSERPCLVPHDKQKQQRREIRVTFDHVDDRKYGLQERGSSTFVSDSAAEQNRTIASMWTPVSKAITARQAGIYPQKEDSLFRTIHHRIPQPCRWFSRTTGWRNHAVHAQVFHHLPVVIKGVN